MTMIVLTQRATSFTNAEIWAMEVERLVAAHNFTVPFISGLEYRPPAAQEAYAILTIRRMWNALDRGPPLWTSILPRRMLVALVNRRFTAMLAIPRPRFAPTPEEEEALERQFQDDDQEEEPT